MVLPKSRCEKRNGSCGTFREVNKCNEHEGTIGADKRAEESPIYHNDNTTIHVYATQWTKHYCILHGNYCDEGNGDLNYAFDCSNHDQWSLYV